VGRDLEIAEVAHLLPQEDCQLLTLTGAGGVGKTRLALQAAQEVGKNYPDGAYFVPLDSLTSASSIPAALAATLGIELQGLEG
jgi:predicted ATPase